MFLMTYYPTQVWVFTAAFVETWLSLMGFLSTRDLMHILGGNSTPTLILERHNFEQNNNKMLKALFQSIYRAIQSDNFVS